MKKGPQAQYCTLPPTPKPSITKCDMLLSHDFTPEAADAPSTSIHTFAAQTLQPCDTVQVSQSHASAIVRHDS